MANPRNCFEHYLLLSPSSISTFLTQSTRVAASCDLLLNHRTTIIITATAPKKAGMLNHNANDETKFFKSN